MLPDLEQYRKNVGSPIVRPSGPANLTISNILDAGRTVRDFQLWELPILPEAAQVFQQLASSREWACSGKIRAAQRSVDWLNSAISKDPMTGQTYYGFQQFEQRRALDAVVIGRTSFFASMTDIDAPLEYIDPTYLRFYRNTVVLKSGEPDTPRPNELVWQYRNARNFRAGEIFLDHLLPVGANYFLAPITSVLRTAKLAWLLEEHEQASLDGRKIRDILLIGNSDLGDAMENAILQQVAAWSGADPESLGISVIGINNPGGQPIENQIYRLGLSEIPDNFDRAKFYDRYVNQIAAALGLALRQFWNNEKTTNRALEEVQEARQQWKGPNLFVKSEERLINNSGILNRFGTGVNKVRFGFIEETDVSSRIANATYLKQTTDGLKSMFEVFGQTIDMESYLAWMQNTGALPYEIELSDNPPVDSQRVVNADANSMNKPGETTISGDAAPTAFAAKKEKDAKNLYNLLHGDVAINSRGEIVDKRVKTFSVLKFLVEEELENKRTLEEMPSDEEAFELAIKEAGEQSRKYFKEAYPDYAAEIKQWSQDQKLRHTDTVMGAINKCIKDEVLSGDEQDIIDTLVDYIRDSWSAGGEPYEY